MGWLVGWIGSFGAVLALCSSVSGALHAQNLSPFAVRKAEQLLATQWSCLGCHQLRGTGGVLGPALDGVRARRDPAYIAAMVTDPQRVKPGALMPRPRLSASERALVIRYLGGEVGAVPAPGGSASGGGAGGSVPDGAVLYRQWCAGCHGAAGGGDGPNAKSLPVAPARHNDGAVMSQRTDDVLYDTIDGGGAIMKRSARMPAFGGTLTPGEIRAVVAHLRRLCRCAGPSWSRDGGR
jgi:mono/diheme cytochrome c family protein